MWARYGSQHRGAALVEPVDLLLPEEEDSAEDNFAGTIGMSLRISQGEGRTPRSAKHLPAFNGEVFAEFLDVGDQVPGSVSFERRVRCALAAATLVEVHDAVFAGVEEAALFRIGTAAWAAVQKDHRLAGGVAGLFEVEVMDR